MLYPIVGIRLSPIIAAAAIALSWLSVVGNANRLRGWQPGPLPDAAPAHVTLQVQIGTIIKTPDHSREETTMQEAAPAKAFIDPVCGMTVAPETAAASRDVDGTTYYFCSTHCAATFDADPGRYTSTAARQ